MIEAVVCKQIIVIDDEAMIRDSLNQLLTLEGMRYSVLVMQVLP